jgi:hypothetical protein
MVSSLDFEIPDSLFAVQYSGVYTTHTVLFFFFTIALIGVVSFIFSCFEPHSYSTTTQEQQKKEDVGTSSKLQEVHSNNERTEQGNKANHFFSALSKYEPSSASMLARIISLIPQGLLQDARAGHFRHDTT